MGRPSLKINMLLNSIKGIMQIAFPLISFPYVSRVLGVENIGRYNFSNSVISYFALLAGLGINTYAIRDGARIKRYPAQMSLFVSEVFTINVISALVSYGLFLVSIGIVLQFRLYKDLLLILSLQILFKTVGVEWVYSIYEDYLYITVRSIVFQILSLLLLIIFVKSEKHLLVYAVITVIACAGSNVMNFIHVKKYCRIRCTWKIHWKKHMRPILVLFAMALTVSIYVSSDTTILGFICGDYEVGLYTVSVKIYSIVKTLLSSVLIVSIPRLSSLLGQNNYNGFNKLALEIYKMLITVVTPAMVGLILLRKEIVVIVSGNSYIEASVSLGMLAVALYFCMGAWFWGQCILVPMNKEIEVFRVTIVSAALNVVLKLCFIPYWGQKAAALTTILAEGITFVWCRFQSGKEIRFQGIEKTYLKVALGCMGIVAISYILKLIILRKMVYTVFVVFLSGLFYFVIELLVKNECIYSMYDAVRKKVSP